MSAVPEHVFHEILARGFRGYQYPGRHPVFFGYLSDSISARSQSTNWRTSGRSAASRAKTA